MLEARPGKGLMRYTHERCNTRRLGRQPGFVMKPRNKGRLQPFIPLMKATKNTPAWRALSHGARSLCMALHERYNTKLQNHVYLTGRAAAKELGSHSHRDYVRRWFRELEYYGIIRMVSLPHHGLNGHGRAAHYRLTEESYLGKPPTRDFLNWDGAIFHEQKTPADYQTKNRSRGPYVRSTLDQTCGPLSDKPALINGNSGPDVRSMCEQDSDPDARSITSLTTPKPEWRTPELIELRWGDWDIDIKSIPVSGTHVTDSTLPSAWPQQDLFRGGTSIETWDGKPPASTRKGPAPPPVPSSTSL